MSRIVTDVEGAASHSAPLSLQSSRPLWRVRRPALALLAASSLAFIPALATSSASQAATATSLQASADQLQQEIQAAGAQISALGQRYDQAENELTSIDNQITTTKNKIAADQHTVAIDQVHLRSVAVNAYVSDGTAGQANPLFSGNQRTFAAEQEYGQVATGNLDVTLANLHTAQIALSAERTNLLTQQGSAQAAVNAAAAAQSAANQQQAALESDLSQVKGQLGALEAQAQARANGLEGSVTRGALASDSNFPPPPSSGGAGGRAVAAAESQIGVPYVWGGESPGRGFDCSGLVAWAWGQAGVSLPHYSGAQMADSAPVPVSDLEPGDLLFYGPGGSNHVAMYVGSGEMIEAPYTGATVWITSLRLGDGFAGAGRP
jgi:cell wall-associated NlpC family hydrolase